MSGGCHFAGCQCGAIRAEIKGAPKFVANCHCTSCRKATGGAFSTWVGFASDQVSWNSLSPYLFKSSKSVERGFCKDCGTPLTYSSDKWPGETHFLIGVMDAPDCYTPTGEVFGAEALNWVQHISEG